MMNNKYIRLLLAGAISFALFFSACTAGPDPAPGDPAAPGAAYEDPEENGGSLISDEEIIPLSSKNDTITGEKDVKDLTGDFTVYFLDVGQGDSALIVTDSKTMLIDGGPSAKSSYVYSFLKSHEITHIDYMIATHAHEDHVGGLSGALNFAEAGVAYCPVTEYDTKAFRSFVRYLAGQKKEITVPDIGDNFFLGDAEVTIIGTIKGSDDVNNTSLVIRVTYGETSFLFTGDAERESEQEILESDFDIQSTVLKVGHHGSETSTTYPFLREALPQYAVIPVGKDNPYGHPTEAVLSRLKDADVIVYRSDLNGIVTFTSDGKTVTVETEKGGPAQSDIMAPPPGDPKPGLQGQAGFLGNSNSNKFHKISCGTGQRTLEKNRVYFSAREEAIKQGYVPAKCCNP